MRGLSHIMPVIGFDITHHSYQKLKIIFSAKNSNHTPQNNKQTYFGGKKLYFKRAVTQLCLPNEYLFV